MNGLELSRKYFNEVGLPAFRSAMPQLLEAAAFGLAGEGSECLGFDDGISRDHDWGPGFCVWLTDEDYEVFGKRAAQIYDSLPKDFMGFGHANDQPQAEGRRGVMRISDFFMKYTGLDRAPQSLAEWNSIPQSYFAVVTNGEIWSDPRGVLSAQREKILAYYPEDVRKKRIAAAAALAAQSGQYNYYRIAQRGDTVAAYQAIGEFIDSVQELAFLLNRRYKPFYKWSARALKELPILGKELTPLLKSLCTGSPVEEDKGPAIERCVQLIIAELKRQGLSYSRSDFLLHHGEDVQASIEDPGLRALHIMAE